MDQGVNCTPQLLKPMPRAVLEQHKADVVTTIFIPFFNEEIFPNYPEISYKTDFKDILRPLNPKKKQCTSLLESPLLEGGASSSETLNNGEKEDYVSRKGSNGSHKSEYSRSNIIDLLEKKYCGGYGMLDHEYEDKEESSWEDSPAPSTEGGGEGGKKKKKRKKGGKEQQGDYYDMDDSFIDDSDNITEIHSQISGKHLKTKHSGFFINAGNLEVLEGSDDHAFHSLATKKKSKCTGEGNKEKHKGLVPGTITPYHMFFKAKKASIRASNPEVCMEQGGLNKLLGSMWKGLSQADRAVYASAATEAMKKAGANSSAQGHTHKAKMKAKKMKENGGGGGAVNPFLLFGRVNRAAVRTAHSAACMEHGGMNKLLGIMWKEVSESEKNSWSQMTLAGNAIKARIKSTLLQGFECFCASKRAGVEEEVAVAPQSETEWGDKNVDKRLAAMWGELSDKERADWEVRGNDEKERGEAQQSIQGAETAFLATGAVTGFELFSVSQSIDPSSNDKSSAEQIKEMWQSSAVDRRLWEAAAVTIGEDLAAWNDKQAKGVKKKRMESKEGAELPPGVVTKKIKQEISVPTNAPVAALDTTSAEPKKKKKNASAAVKAAAAKAAANIAVTKTMVTTDTPSEVAVKKKNKKIITSPTATDIAALQWSSPPMPVAEALSALQQIVSDEVFAQHEADQSKSKKGKTKTTPSPAPNQTPFADNLSSISPLLPLKKLTVAVEERLDSLDALAVQWNMPGAQPLMKATKIPSKTTGDASTADAGGDSSTEQEQKKIKVEVSVSATTTTSEASTEVSASPSQRPLSYLDVLYAHVNAPNGSSISANQVRNSLLRHRCRRLITTLSDELEAEIPVLAAAIRAKIEVNAKFDPAAATAAAAAAAAAVATTAITTTLTTAVNSTAPFTSLVAGSNEEETLSEGGEKEEKDKETEKEKEKKEKVVTAPLPYVCKWDKDLRRHLFAVLDKAAQWVNAENENRDKYLSAHEKKSLEAAQVESLSNLAQSTAVYHRIISLAFIPPSDTSSCEKSDIYFMRRVVAAEKQRLKNAI